MPGLVGKSLGRYEIVDHLGAGGMGEVYRANDTQLGRAVAIKVISGKIAQSKRAIERFEREAKTVAQLSHPNILNIHDFGRDQGVVYAVTELLEGKDLRDRISGSMLPLSKVIEVGTAVSNGLAAAHSKGIIHRDIKPENIFVTSTGQVKILDFGIAGLKAEATPKTVTTDARTESLTKTGDVLGTAGYMAPEQARGGHVDARTDIFALGCLLYEMLTGHRAFRGETSQDTVLAILNRDPDPMTDHRPDVPPALEVIVKRCLEKQPNERFESARDVAFALQTISGARPSVQKTRATATIFGVTRSRISAIASVGLIAAAVLAWIGMRITNAQPPLPSNLKLGLAPFDAASDDTSLVVFGAGLREILADDLALIAQHESRIDWVVPTKESTEKKALTATDLGRYFGVTVAVTGVLRRFDERIRLDLHLVDPKMRRPLRSQSIEDIPSNVDAFQSGPVLRVMQMLGVEIRPEMMELLQAGGTTMTSAFDAYTRGRGTMVLRQNQNGEISASAFARIATSEDPLYAAAWVLQARCDLVTFESSGDTASIDAGLDSANRALDLGERDGDAWRMIGKLHLAAGHNNQAITALENGLRAAPDDAELRLDLAETLEKSGRIEDAEAELQRAIFLRPNYWVPYDRLATIYRSQGMWEAAAVEYQHALDCAPEYALAYVKLGGVNWFLGRLDTAVALFERSLDIEPTYYALSNLGSIHFNAYRYAAAAEMFERALKLDESNYVVWGNLGYAYQFGIQPEKAAAAFTRALELAREKSQTEPDNYQHPILIAGYYAMLGEHDKGLEILRTVIDAQPTNPLYMSLIAEASEDLGERDLALEWVQRAFAAGEPRSRFEGRPTLRRLVADERYQALVNEDGYAR